MNDNNQYGYGYSQMPNGYNNGYNYQAYQYKIKRKYESKQIRKLGLMTGAALLSFIFLQNIIISILVLTGFYEKYVSDPMISTGLDILFSVIEILPPFLLFGKMMKKETGIKDIVPLEMPKDRTLSILAIPAGVGICMAANIVTSYLTVFLGLFGMKLSLPDVSDPPGIFGFIVSVLRVAVVAAIVEEISLRGCVMQPLRKYGDSFAIVASACAFGLMHCNLIQAPFALIVGLGFGYIAIKTNSLVCVIVVHAINNFISTAMSYAIDAGVNETLINVIYSVIVYFSIAVGFVCLFLFIRRAKYISPSIPVQSYNSALGKGWAYISNPTMIISIIIMLYYTSQYVEIV